MQTKNITNLKHEWAEAARPGRTARTRSSSLILRAQDFSFCNLHRYVFYFQFAVQF